MPQVLKEMSGGRYKLRGWLDRGSVLRLWSDGEVGCVGGGIGGL